MPGNPDRRYSLMRWTKLAQYIRKRDPHCYVVNCPLPVKAADHIIPATLDMPDWQFFDPSNLRGSCRRHNTARGVAARLEREVAEGVAPPPRRYSYGARRSGFLSRATTHDSALPKSLHTARSSLVTADYSRNSAERGDA
jgi:hypothetical protein